MNQETRDTQAPDSISDSANTEAPKQYFLSYSRTDYYFTRDLSIKLKENGLNIWFDQEQILPGENWQKEIQTGLENSVGMILVISRFSLQSPYVALEWQSAIRDNKPIYLVLAEAFDIDTLKIAKDDNIDTSHYNFDDLIHHASKIVDGRRWFGRQSTLLAKHIVNNKDIKDRQSIPKPASFDIQLTTSFTIQLITFLLFISALSYLFWSFFLPINIFLTATPIEGIIFTVILSIIFITIAILTLMQTVKIAVRDDFSIAQVRFLLLASIVVSIFTIPFQVLIPFQLLALHRIIYLHKGVLRWLKRHDINNASLDEANVEERIGYTGLPHGIGIVLYILTTLYYRLFEPPLRLAEEDKDKTPPSYTLAYVDADYRIARNVKKRLNRFKIKESDEETSDMIIAIITNHSEEAYLKKLLTSEKRLVTILASSIDSNSHLKQLQTLQWFDYRKHQEIQLFDLARTIISQGNSYMRGLPPSLESFIVPSRVKSTIWMFRLITALSLIMLVILLTVFIVEEPSPEAYLGLTVFTLASIWTMWRITKEKEKIINRSIKLSTQSIRFIGIYMPIVVVSFVGFLLSEYFILAIVTSISLLSFIFIALYRIKWWFPTGDLNLDKAKESETKVLA